MNATLSILQTQKLGRMSGPVVEVYPQPVHARAHIHTQTIVIYPKSLNMQVLYTCPTLCHHSWPNNLHAEPAHRREQAGRADGSESRCLRQKPVLSELNIGRRVQLSSCLTLHVKVQCVLQNLCRPVP